MSVKNLLTFAIALLIAPGLRSESKYQYLEDTANAIFDLESRSMEPTAEQINEIASRACKTLQRLLRDKAFADDLYRLEKASLQSREFNRLRRDLTQFAEFLSAEASLMKKAGLSDRAILETLSAASLFRDALGPGARPDAKRILDSINSLQGEICSDATTMTEKLTAQQRRLILARWAVGLGGLAMIGVDATATVPTGGLATASFALGGALAGAAAGAAVAR